MGAEPEVSASRRRIHSSFSLVRSPYRRFGDLEMYQQGQTLKSPVQLAPEYHQVIWEEE